MSHVDLTYGKLQTYDLETQEKVFNSLVFDQNEMDSILVDVQGDSLVAKVRGLCNMYKATARRLTQMQGHYKPYDELVELLRKPGLEPTPRAVVTHFVGITDQLKELGTAINQQPHETPLQAYTRSVNSFVITDADGNTLDYEISDGCIVLDERNRKPKVNEAATELNALRVELDKALCCEHPINPKGDLSRLTRVLRLRRELDKACKPGSSSNEQRYMVDDDIKPCTVLYSDDETTLVRTEDGDHMFNTGAIAWSDEETYKVQELLKRNDIAYNGTAVWCIKELAKLGHLVITDEGFEREPVPEVDDTPNQFESLANSQASTLVKREAHDDRDVRDTIARRLGNREGNHARRSCITCGTIFEEGQTVCPKGHISEWEEPLNNPKTLR